MKGLAVCYLLSLYRLDAGVDDFRSRNSTGNHTNMMGATVGNG